MVNDVIFFAGLGSQFQVLAQGLIIILALAVGGLLTKRSQTKACEEKSNEKTPLALRKAKTIIKSPSFIAPLLCLIILFVGNIISPGFASSELIINILVVSSFVGLVSGGQFLIVLGGGNGLDLSLGKLVTLGAIVGGVISQKQDANLSLALLTVIVVTFSLINGWGHLL